ncbi:hypothetical protein BJ170DRAFT_725868 [Xylariales sp. AK1849]|nr:hypothetical protein BJ170DRAFT_725868 [Xylariales sp. AK1849]
MCPHITLVDKCCACWAYFTDADRDARIRRLLCDTSRWMSQGSTNPLDFYGSCTGNQGTGTKNGDSKGTGPDYGVEFVAGDRLCRPCYAQMLRKGILEHYFHHCINKGALSWPQYVPFLITDVIKNPWDFNIAVSEYMADPISIFPSPEPVAMGNRYYSGGSITEEHPLNELATSSHTYPSNNLTHMQPTSEVLNTQPASQAPQMQPVSGSLFGTEIYLDREYD